MFNAEVLFREDCTADEFIDVIQGNRIYMPCLYVSNFVFVQKKWTLTVVKYRKIFDDFYCIQISEYVVCSNLVYRYTTKLTRFL